MCVHLTHYQVPLLHVSLISIKTEIQTERNRVGGQNSGIRTHLCVCVRERAHTLILQKKIEVRLKPEQN